VDTIWESRDRMSIVLSLHLLNRIIRDLALAGGEGGVLQNLLKSLNFG
jgi:hypothetical protein